MDTPAPDPVAQVLGQLLRQPEPLRELELERALLRLQAARPDAAYLLLHRVMVLETALQQLKAGADGGVQVAAAPARTRSFLRDAAVVTAGVVAGQALFNHFSEGVSDTPAADGGDGLDIEGWL